MTGKAVFHHAGCAVCVDAERRFALDNRQHDVEVVHGDVYHLSHGPIFRRFAETGGKHPC